MIKCDTIQFKCVMDKCKNLCKKKNLVLFQFPKGNFLYARLVRLKKTKICFNFRHFNRKDYRERCFKSCASNQSYKMIKLTETKRAKESKRKFYAKAKVESFFFFR